MASCGGWRWLVWPVPPRRSRRGPFAPVRKRVRISPSPCCSTSRSARSGRPSTASSPSTSAASSTTASGSVPNRRSPNIDGIRQRAGRARPQARAGRRPLAGRLLRRQVPLARRHRPALQASAPVRPLARGDRDQPVRHPRVHPLLPALRRRALSRRQRRHRLARGIPAVGRILQRTGRLDHPRRRARGQRRSASRSASATGASATRAGAAAASSSPRIIAANTAGSPTGCPQYGVPLYLIAAGPNGNDLDWTRRFFAKWADGQRAPIQGWAPHYYCGTTGHALKFNQRPVVRAAPQGQPDGDARSRISGPRSASSTPSTRSSW